MFGNAALRRQTCDGWPNGLDKSTQVQHCAHARTMANNIETNLRNLHWVAKRSNDYTIKITRVVKAVRNLNWRRPNAYHVALKNWSDGLKELSCDSC